MRQDVRDFCRKNYGEPTTTREEREAQLAQHNQQGFCDECQRAFAKLLLERFPWLAPSDDDWPSAADQMETLNDLYHELKGSQ